MAMYETVGREGEPVSAIGTKPICESDRKVHLFASENLFISYNNTLFHRIFDALSWAKNQNCKIPCSFEDICKKHMEIRDFFFTKLKELFSLKQTIFMNIIGASNSFFWRSFTRKIRKRKFSVVSKIYTKNGSKIDKFYSFF